MVQTGARLAHELGAVSRLRSMSMGGGGWAGAAAQILVPHSGPTDGAEPVVTLPPAGRMDLGTSASCGAGADLASAA